MKIYLAGKITKGGWRDTLLGYRPMSQTASDVEEIEKRGGNPWEPCGFTLDDESHICTGPFFISCDHGCFHGPTTHATLGDLGTCCSTGNEPLAGGMRIPFSDDRAFARWRLTQLCFRAIDESNLVFAWFDAPGAYGTMFELGYALAKGKSVAIATDPNMPYEDFPPRASQHGNFVEQEANHSHWFAQHACCNIGTATTPTEGLRQAIEWANHHPNFAKPWALSLCESPIEIKLLEAMWNHGATPVGKNEDRTVARWLEGSLRSQFRVDALPSYRPDFSLVNRSGVVKAIVEADGHAFHERTREQATHDKARDREFATAGIHVLRFTGSDIHNNPQRCAQEVLDFSRSDAMR
jgi:very-short-patch-repair endonuclease